MNLAQFSMIFLTIFSLQIVHLQDAVAQNVVISIEKNNDEKNVDPKSPFHGVRPAADMAILIDTSNSMDGLIAQAKSQLWNIVQQFSRAKKAGKTPLLRVAVFEYGNTNLPASEGYIRQVVGLTDDLDKVSEALFGLTTRGGDEYCGQVINEALSRLDWNSEPNAFKAIFIAGNEPFTQGPVDYQSSCKKAIQNGVVVNTIHCGDYQTGISTKWKHGAELAEGDYMNINQDRAVVSIKTPQDKILIELNEELNKTYLWYGQRDKRKRWSSNQEAQDANAFGAGAFGGRIAIKGGKMYNNAGRDLVDSFKLDDKVLETLVKDELPDSLQSLSKSEQLAKVEEMTQKRSEIQKKIAQANRLRVDFIKNEKKKLAESKGGGLAGGGGGRGGGGGSTLGDAIESAVAAQLEKSGFKIEK